MANNMTNGIEILDPPTLGTVVVIIGAVFGAVGYAFAAFTKGRGKAIIEQGTANKDANDATNFVITALKEQIAVLEKRVSDQAKGLEAMGLRLETVIKENATLRDILQGRDNQTQKFQEEGFKAMQQSAVAIGTISAIELRVNKILDIIEHREVIVTQLHKDIKETLDKAKAG